MRTQAKFYGWCDSLLCRRMEIIIKTHIDFENSWKCNQFDTITILRCTKFNDFFLSWGIIGFESGLSAFSNFIPNLLQFYSNSLHFWTLLVIIWFVIFGSFSEYFLAQFRMIFGTFWFKIWKNIGMIKFRTIFVWHICHFGRIY